jgi:hypothetical protein
MRQVRLFEDRLILLSRKTPRPFRNSSCPDAIVVLVVRCLSDRVSAAAFAPPPRHPMEHRGEVLSAWFPALRSRRARTDT